MIGFERMHVIPNDGATFGGFDPPAGIRPDRLAAWQQARGMLADLKPLPSDVITLAAFLVDLADDDPDDDPEYDDAPGFSPGMLIDWFPPVRLLRRLLG